MVPHRRRCRVEQERDNEAVETEDLAAIAKKTVGGKGKGERKSQTEVRKGGERGRREQEGG